MVLLHSLAANRSMNDEPPMPLGNPHPDIVPYEKCATATEYVFIADGNDEQSQRL